MPLFVVSILFKSEYRALPDTSHGHLPACMDFDLEPFSRNPTDHLDL